MDEPYLTIKQAVTVFHYSDRRIREFCKEGKFPGARKLPEGRKWLIPREDIERYKQRPADGHWQAAAKKEHVHQVQDPPVTKREICNMIQDWGFYLRAPRLDEISLRTSVPDSSIEAQPLFKDIWQVVFPEILRQDYGAWRGETAKYLGICKSLIAQVEKEITSWRDVSFRRGSFHRPIFRRLARKADGKQPKPHEINIIRLVTKENTELMEVDGWPILEGQHLSLYRERYCLVSDRIMDNAMSYRLIDGFKKTRQLEEKIHESLQEIIQRYIEYESHTSVM